MPRQSHAKKAAHLLQEMVSDIQTLFTGLAERPDLKNLAAEIKQTGAEINDIMKTAGQGVKTAFKHAQDEAIALVDASQEKIKQKLAVLAEKVQQDSASAEPEAGAWMADQDIVYATAETHPPAQGCGFIGVHPAEMEFAG